MDGHFWQELGLDFFLLFPSGSVINLHGGFMRCRASAFSVFTLFFPLHRSIRVVPAVSPANKQTVFFSLSLWQESDYGS